MPDPDILPMRAPKLRWCVCTRSQGQPWVETDYTEDMVDALTIAATALAAGQCVMIEPCRSAGKAG